MLFYTHLIIPWEQHDEQFLLWLQERLKHWTKPVLVSGYLSDQTRNHTDLVVENALPAGGRDETKLI